MQQIKSVDVMSVAKISGIMYACLAVFVIPFLFLGGLISMASQEQGAVFGGVGMMFFALLAPFIYGAMGFVMGALMAWVYNLIAKRFGGIQIELQPVQPTSNLGLI